MEDLVMQLNQLYKDYKYSYPSERSRINKSRFNALEFEELDDEMLVNGKDRIEAQKALDDFISSNREMLLKTLFQGNHWFWQSDEDEDFIILKEWCYE